MKPYPWLLAVVGALLVTGGCAKRVPSTDLTFEAHQKVVLTFRTGEELEGKISPGSSVELREPNMVWMANVGQVTDEQIELVDLVALKRKDGVELETSRLADARRVAGETAPDKTFLRTEIVGVDHVRIDIGETARQASFWTYGAVVLGLLVGERS
ncbi:MAG: hypothetical protein GF346_07850 [Candidatus Eisenbacteria bacterium]|nr:hypothetical protein [Candidatus Latescibacterota bacterium]MBD3302346.1 hypothetical protein [Candidatus Eisenbacteria bacterium]